MTLHTDLGTLKLEVFCDIVPRTSFNFLALAASGYYDNTLFHRNIKGFMLQGGDPTGTGKGGESIWGGKFNDEIHPDNKHTTRGVVSMANSGPNTNGSQFFITYAKHPHLDNNCAPPALPPLSASLPKHRPPLRPAGLPPESASSSPTQTRSLARSSMALTRSMHSSDARSTTSTARCLRSGCDRSPSTPTRSRCVRARLQLPRLCAPPHSRGSPSLVRQDQMIIFPSANAAPDIQG